MTVDNPDDDASATFGGVWAAGGRAGGMAGGSGGTDRPDDVDDGDDAVARPDVAPVTRAGGGAVAAADLALRAAGGIAADAAGAVAAWDVNTVGGAGGGVTAGRARSGSAVADCVMTAGEAFCSRCIHHARPSKPAEITASARAPVRASD